MTLYRTDEQFNEICDSMLNGNWTQAAEECVKYGFWANDLKMAYENDPELCPIDDIWDFVELIEMAAKYR
jgi:hypothetical protein